MMKDAFDSIHRFINSTQDTELGKGLGLPIADSMFMYCERPTGLSYFEGLTDVPSKESGYIKDAIKEKWIDSPLNFQHAWL